MWRETLPIFEQILGHPFIVELTDGSLSRERFVFYMQQDALYLREFSRALAIAGARLPDAGASQAFYGFAQGALAVEGVLHETYFKQFGVTPDSGKAPACFAYTQYLLAMAATAPPPEAAAALLPCFWIYREVGKEIVRRAESNVASNPYARWIETYSGTEFDQSVARAIDIVEALAAETGDAGREAMRAAYEQSTRLEWMFWDSAYRLEEWPQKA
jgi:thiaminase/transcriptional activator TenA